MRSVLFTDERGFDVSLDGCPVSFFLLSGVQIYFHFPSLTGYQRKNLKKMKKSHLGRFQVQLKIYCVNRKCNIEVT